MSYWEMLKQTTKWSQQRNLLQLIEPVTTEFSSFSTNAFYSFFNNLIGFFCI